MASGDEVIRSDKLLQVLLIDGATGTVDGPWVDIGPYCHNVSIEVSGITSATVTINGSNANGGLPALATAGTAIGSSITADTVASLVGPTRYIRARVTGYSSGTINVYWISRRI